MARFPEYTADQLLASSWQHNRALTQGATQISLCSDKGRYGGTDKYNMTVALPANQAFWCVPQALLFLVIINSNGTTLLRVAVITCLFE